MEVERLIRTLPPGQEDTPTFSDSHPQVSTPEYTPLIIRNRDVKPVSETLGSRDVERKLNKKTLKSVGICAALPMRRVRFFVRLYCFIFVCTGFKIIVSWGFTPQLEIYRATLLNQLFGYFHSDLKYTISY